MTMLRPKGMPQSIIEPSNRKLVRANDETNPYVYAVCHHTDSYLSRNQLSSNGSEKWRGLWAQHDFPGVPGLDAEFRSAAHSSESEHMAFMLPTAIAIILVVAGIATLVLSYVFVIDPVQIAVLVLFSLLIIGLGIVLYIKRHPAYHTLVQRGVISPPLKVSEFPLACTYVINTQEELKANLNNWDTSPPKPADPVGSVKVAIYPEERSQKDWREYRRVWSATSGRTIYAGMVALDQTQHVTFQPGSGVQSRHRLSLYDYMPPEFRQGTYTPKADQPLKTFEARYTIQDKIIYTDKDPIIRRFPLECVPYLDPHNSYVLNLQFRWFGEADGECRLKECRLKFPTALEVTHVELGRYDQYEDEAIWKGIIFNRKGKEQGLTLKVHCKRPILSYQGKLTGSYTFSIGSAISKVATPPEYVWNARGRQAIATKTPDTKCATTITGELGIDITKLTQEHECVMWQKIPCQRRNKPITEVAASVIRVFQKRNINLLRIAQSTPRLDPSGTLYTELLYWDILGRVYQSGLLIPVNVHVVIKSQQYDPRIQGQPPAELEFHNTEVEIYVRGFHDPRNRGLPIYVQTLLSGIQMDLRKLI